MESDTNVEQQEEIMQCQSCGCDCSCWEDAGCDNEEGTCNCGCSPSDKRRWQRRI